MKNPSFTVSSMYINIHFIATACQIICDVVTVTVKWNVFINEFYNYVLGSALLVKLVLFLHFSYSPIVEKIPDNNQSLSDLDSLFNNPFTLISPFISRLRSSKEINNGLNETQTYRVCVYNENCVQGALWGRRSSPSTG